MRFHAIPTSTAHILTTKNIQAWHVAAVLAALLCPLPPTPENKREGDLLKTLPSFKDGSATIPSHLDRANLDVPASQIFFNDTYLIPTFEALAVISEEVSTVAVNCGKANRAHWVEMQQMGVKGIKESLRMAGCSERLCSQPWDCLV